MNTPQPSPTPFDIKSVASVAWEPGIFAWCLLAGIIALVLLCRWLLNRRDKSRNVSSALEEFRAIEKRFNNDQDRLSALSQLIRMQMFRLFGLDLAASTASQFEASSSEIGSQLVTRWIALLKEIEQAMYGRGASRQSWESIREYAEEVLSSTGTMSEKEVQCE